jgi:hypothetical protein
MGRPVLYLADNESRSGFGERIHETAHPGESRDPGLVTRSVASGGALVPGFRRDQRIYSD